MKVRNLHVDRKQNAILGNCLQVQQLNADVSTQGYSTTGSCMDELLKDFLIEAGEALDGYDRDLVELEANPSNYEILNRIFRAMHTIKGTCGFLGFSRLEKLTHSAEYLLDDLRSNKLKVTPDITTSLLAVGDAVRSYLAYIERSGTESEHEYLDLIEQMNQQREQKGSQTTEETLEDAFAQARREWEASQGLLSGQSLGEQPVDKRPELPQTLQVGTQVIETASSEQLSEQRDISVPESDESSKNAAQMSSSRSQAGENSLRVDVNLLDELMNLVGELVLTRNQLLQYTKSQKDAVFLRTSQRLNLITSELQESVMRTRMQPISTVWSKFPRVVRDIARACGKDVVLEMIGQETDLDKTIIEAIKDPMTHLVRNAIDHGIESSEQRLAKGKPERGTLLLRAFHEGGQVIIEISDDGAGLNYERIKKKALERGLTTPAALAKLSDSDIAKFIFEPGFSTQDQVSNISGRGVGMDVVRSNIEKIGGAVDISSGAAQGTVIRIKIPLTLAIVPALLVSTGGERFAIPQVGLQELVRVAGDSIWKEIEEINGVNYYRLRGRLLPLVYLRQELGMQPFPRIASRRGDIQLTTKDDSQQRTDHVLNIVVIRADERTFGLVVDEIHDTEEIVVKPLKGKLKELPVYAGATIMGDGYVALILDVMGLADKAAIDTPFALQADETVSAEEEAERAQAAGSEILIARLDNNRRVAIPLDQITRLENISKETIEFASNWPVIQYRGSILPLVYLGTQKGADSLSSTPGFAIVHSHRGQRWGLVVSEILDITRFVQTRSGESKKGTWRESAIINDKVTDLLDLPMLIDSFSNTTQSSALH